jgi:hypothetical protein
MLEDVEADHCVTRPWSNCLKIMLNLNRHGIPSENLPGERL